MPNTLKQRGEESVQKNQVKTNKQTKKLINKKIDLEPKKKNMYKQEEMKERFCFFLNIVFQNKSHQILM